VNLLILVVDDEPDVEDALSVSLFSALSESWAAYTL